MPSKRDVLDSLSRNDLLSLADGFGVDVPNRRSKAPLVDALAGSRKAKLDAMLSALPIASLKAACEKLELDASGRTKAVLIGRLAASGGRSTAASAKATETAKAKATTSKPAASKKKTAKKAGAAAPARGRVDAKKEAASKRASDLKQKPAKATKADARDSSEPKAAPTKEPPKSEAPKAAAPAKKKAKAAKTAAPSRPAKMPTKVNRPTAETASTKTEEVAEPRVSKATKPVVRRKRDMEAPEATAVNNGESKPAEADAPEAAPAAAEGPTDVKHRPVPPPKLERSWFANDPPQLPASPPMQKGTCQHCKKRISLRQCQIQRCENWIVLEASQPVCAECLFERGQLTLTEFTQTLRKESTCPHCGRPWEKRQSA